MNYWVSLENFWCEMWVETAEIKWGNKLVGGLKDGLFLAAICLYLIKYENKKQYSDLRISPRQTKLQKLPSNSSPLT